MGLIVVEALDEHALESLETNPHIRVVGPVQSAVDKDVAAAPPRVVRKWAGSISSESAAAWLKHLEEVRNEWERDF